MLKKILAIRLAELEASQNDEHGFADVCYFHCPTDFAALIEDLFIKVFASLGDLFFNPPGVNRAALEELIQGSTSNRSAEGVKA